MSERQTPYKAFPMDERGITVVDIDAWLRTQEARENPDTVRANWLRAGVNVDDTDAVIGCSDEQLTSLWMDLCLNTDIGSSETCGMLVERVAEDYWHE